MNNSTSQVSPGMVFGRWTVLEFSHKVKKNCFWRCRCECGVEKVVYQNTFKYGKGKSCGCLRREILSRIRATHGQSRKGKVSQEYNAWSNMIKRCTDSTLPSWPDYGGRGIMVCDEWMVSFDAFYRYIGPKPTPKHTLDRWPDNDRGYEPGNVRWATRKQQTDGRRNSVKILYSGTVLSLHDAAKKYGMAYDTLKARLKYGWTIEMALNKKVRAVI